MKEKQLDQILSIETRGIQKGFHTSPHYHRYEPTPYTALEKLFQAYSVKSTDRWVDYGCGKGRIGFYLHAFHGISSIGIEMDGDFLRMAKKNLAAYAKKRSVPFGEIQFLEEFAQDYMVRTNETVFYFFNPFSVQVFIKVVGRILRSVEASPREITIILYYPSIDYCEFLERHTVFTRVQEIAVVDDLHNQMSECFYIYRLANFN